MSSSIQKTDFLRFSAYSIKDLITRKLAQDSKFTDQIYEGSNLAVLIDIVSYMYQCLIYQLNNAASESMFADTQLYENMVRLVRFLGYSPRGCIPSALKMTLTPQQGQYDFPDYSYIETGKTDSKGRKICFSLTEKPSLEQSQSVSITLCNGIWRKCGTVYTASGLRNETILLGGLRSSTEDQEFVSNTMIRVFVKEPGQDSKWTKWEYDRNGIFISSKQNDYQGNNTFLTLTNSEQNVYTLNLNQDKQYELVFGDGIIGRKLVKDSQITVFYLDSNGVDGDIDFASIDWSKIRFRIPDDISRLKDDDMKRLLYDPFDEQQFLEEYELTFQNDYQYVLGIDTSDGNPLIVSVPEESVDEIRENAPNWFKTGYRLITKSDYENFIKNNSTLREQMYRGDSIIDVKCMNNVDYVTKFYKWLYMQGLKRNVPNGRYYFDGNFFQRNEYSYIDPSDTNNLYLWIKTTSEAQSESSSKRNTETLNSILKNIRVTTTELNVLNPITVNFDICASSVDYAKQNYLTSSVFDMEAETTLEITISDNVSYVSNVIQNAVRKILQKYFNQNTMTLGMVVDPTCITNKIYELNGVENVRTIWKSPYNDGIIKAQDGISFASWSKNDILEQFEDFSIGNNAVKLEDFQFPSFGGFEMLDKRIVVIKKRMSTINTITF